MAKRVNLPQNSIKLMSSNHRICYIIYFLLKTHKLKPSSLQSVTAKELKTTSDHFRLRRACGPPQLATKQNPLFSSPVHPGSLSNTAEVLRNLALIIPDGRTHMESLDVEAFYPLHTIKMPYLKLCIILVEVVHLSLLSYTLAVIGRCLL